MKTGPAKPEQPDRLLRVWYARMHVCKHVIMHGLNSKLANRLLAMWVTPPTPRGWIGQTGGQGDKAINICTHRKYYILQHVMRFLVLLP